MALFKTIADSLSIYCKKKSCHNCQTKKKAYICIVQVERFDLIATTEKNAKTAQVLTSNFSHYYLLINLIK